MQAGGHAFSEPLVALGLELSRSAGSTSRDSMPVPIETYPRLIREGIQRTRGRYACERRGTELLEENAVDVSPKPVPSEIVVLSRAGNRMLNALVQPLLAVSPSAAPLAITSASRRCSEVPGSISICRGFAAAQRAE